MVFWHDPPPHFSSRGVSTASRACRTRIRIDDFSTKMGWTSHIPGYSGLSSGVIIFFRRYSPVLKLRGNVRCPDFDVWKVFKSKFLLIASDTKNLPRGAARALLLLFKRRSGNKLHSIWVTIGQTCAIITHVQPCHLLPFLCVQPVNAPSRVATSA